MEHADPPLVLDTSAWLRKHGKHVKPKLTPQQVRQLQSCFSLMDEDGSGAIDAGELGNAFKLLGIRLKLSEIQAMVDEVDDDGSGELEYKEFVQIMTSLLTKTDTTKGQPASALPFEVTATAYRRKKLLEAMKRGDKDMIASLATSTEEETPSPSATSVIQSQGSLRPSNPSRSDSQAQRPASLVTSKSLNKRVSERPMQMSHANRSSTMPPLPSNAGILLRAGNSMNVEGIQLGAEEQRIIDRVLREAERERDQEGLLALHHAHSVAHHDGHSSVGCFGNHFRTVSAAELRTLAPSPVLRRLRSRIPNSPHHQELLHSPTMAAQPSGLARQPSVPLRGAATWSSKDWGHVANALTRTTSNAHKSGLYRSQSQLGGPNAPS